MDKKNHTPQKTKKKQSQRVLILSGKTKQKENLIEYLKYSKKVMLKLDHTFF